MRQHEHHWAFALFSRNAELQRVFIEALAERDGTLALGRLNLLEFSRVTDAAQLRAAKDFVQALLPRLAKGANVVVLDRDMAKVFPTSKAVDNALRVLAEAGRRHGKTK